MSSARNYGLDQATGAYISFVDADDWIEPNTYETALRFCKDICVFGYSKNYPGTIQLYRPVNAPETVDSEETVKRLIIDDSISYGMWNKLYRSRMLDDVRFPNGMIYEDIVVTYKILSKADTVALIPNVLYHYVQYEGSLVHDPAAKNLLDRWTATYELIRICGEKDETIKTACMRNCAYSIYRAWGSLWKTDRETRRQEKDRIREIILFAEKKQALCRSQHKVRRACKNCGRFGVLWRQMDAVGCLFDATDSKDSKACALVQSNRQREQPCLMR